MKFLGIDLGSSSVKVSVYDAHKQLTQAKAFYPKTELEIKAPQAGWAEQNPDRWWESLKGALQAIRAQTDLREIKSIGISYQMHGLVAVDKNQQVVRPSIIWCDSRAVELGEDAFQSIGEEQCLSCLLNSPGNFTASKLGWVQKYEPEVYARIDKIMLPGDFLAMKLSGQVSTTAGGLSEGVLWDFEKRSVSKDVLGHFGFDESLIPTIVPAIGPQAVVSASAAEELGLSPSTQITYRAGDQPNNALSLNVLQPGELATTAGTSAVIYAVTDKNEYDRASRVNSFLHVNDSPEHPRNGILLCVNGSGILYSWLKRTLNMGSESVDYDQLNEMAKTAPVGSDGLHFMPFGNGAERILNNRNVNAHLQNLDFNLHTYNHIIRAAKEGIVFAMNYGLEIIREMGTPTEKIRAGASNMFQSELFREAFVNTTGVPLELFETDGAEGAARAAAVGYGYQNLEDAFKNLKKIETIVPNDEASERYGAAYASWKEDLGNLLNVS